MTALLDAFALMLEYPGGNFREIAGTTCDALAQDLRRSECGIPEEAFQGLQRFRDGIAPLSDDTAEELYTTTFDLNPQCCLDLGWHLFGENYDRGNFMVKMRDHLRIAGIDEAGQLPDHLPLALRLLGRLEKDEARALYTQTVAPAITKMLKNFTDETNPYHGLLGALDPVLASVLPDETGA